MYSGILSVVNSLYAILTSWLLQYFADVTSYFQVVHNQYFMVDNTGNILVQQTLHPRQKDVLYVYAKDGDEGNNDTRYSEYVVHVFTI